MSSQTPPEVAPRAFQKMIGPSAQVRPALDAAEPREPPRLLPVAAAAGAAAAGAAGLWAFITVAGGIQIGWMAVGVGFLVGITVRVAGAGRHPTLGYMGAFFALLGCLTGNLLAICGMVAADEGSTWIQVLSQLDLPTLNRMMILTFHPIDLLFYGLALYFGYKLSLDNDGMQAGLHHGDTEVTEGIFFRPQESPRDKPRNV